MKIKLKEEYAEWSVGTKTKKVVKLKNLDPSLWADVALEHPEFFLMGGEIKKPIAKKED